MGEGQITRPFAEMADAYTIVPALLTVGIFTSVMETNPCPNGAKPWSVQQLALTPMTEQQPASVCGPRPEHDGLV